MQAVRWPKIEPRAGRKNGIAAALGLLVAAFAFGIGSPAGAGDRAFERLGDLQVSNFLLEPTFFYSEPQTGQFQPGNSLASISWYRDAIISGKITVGTKALLGQPARYGPASEQDLGIVEGYAQAEGYLGQARLGLIPLPFGLEGGDVEGHLRFPRSLIFQRRMIPLRDYGAGYAIDWNGFFSEWEAHNGEAGKDLDNQIWLTARWGWSPNARFRVGASGATGRTTVKSTNPSGTSSSTAAWIDVGQPSRTRVGNVFVDWNAAPIGLAAEATVGETAQDGNNLAFSGGHADLYWTITPEFAGLARWDQYGARSDRYGTDWAQEITLGAAFRQPYETSVIYLYVSKSMQKDVSPDQHVVRLVWRLTPYIGARQ